MLNNQEYVELEGTVCPRCESEDLRHGRPDLYGLSDLMVPIWCVSDGCDFEGIEWYSLDGYEEQKLG